MSVDLHVALSRKALVSFDSTTGSNKIFVFAAGLGAAGIAAGLVFYLLRTPSSSRKEDVEADLFAVKGELNLFSSWNGRTGGGPSDTTNDAHRKNTTGKDFAAFIGDQIAALQTTSGTTNSMEERRRLIVKHARAIRQAVEPVDVEWEPSDSDSDGTDVSFNYHCARDLSKMSKDDLLTAVERHQQVCQETPEDEAAKHQSLLNVLDMVVDHFEMVIEKESLKKRLKVLHGSACGESERDDGSGRVELVEDDPDTQFSVDRKAQRLMAEQDPLSILAQLASRGGRGRRDEVGDERGDGWGYSQGPVPSMVHHGVLEDESAWEDDDDQWGTLEGNEYFDEEDDEEDFDMDYNGKGVFGADAEVSSDEEEELLFESEIFENLATLAEEYGVSFEDMEAVERMMEEKKKEAKERKAQMKRAGKPVGSDRVELIEEGHGMKNGKKARPTSEVLSGKEKKGSKAPQTKEEEEWEDVEEGEEEEWEDLEDADEEEEGTAPTQNP